MVHFQGTWCSCDRNEYWKLHFPGISGASRLRDFLERKKFAVLKRTTVERLRVHYARYQRGLLSYEGLPLRELKLYAAQRALPPIVDKKITVNVLKAHLEKADDEATFDRFSSLPPELRQIIYTLYFKSFKSFSTRPHRSSTDKNQPPITIISRDVRRESLPLFYECCLFQICAPLRQYHGLQRDFNTALVDPSRNFIRRTSAQNFARIRHVFLDFFKVKVQLNLEPTKTKELISITWNEHPRVERNISQARQERRDRLSSGLREFAQRIAAREGTLKLLKADLEYMYKLTQDVIFEESQ